MTTQELQQTFAAPGASAARSHFLLWLPAGYDSCSRWPLLLFLHGSGERGRDLEQVKRHGPPKLAARQGELPFVLLCPQCPGGRSWSAEGLVALLDHVQGSHAIDPDRVAVTGLSMGGYGTWSLALRFPDRFAAIAPVCGGGNPRLARRIRHLPVWAFHGARDQAVPLAESEAMIAALRRAGGEPRFTVYPDADHDLSWERAYADPALYAWLLAQRRKPPAP